MEKENQVRKARRLHDLHAGPDVLVLPNIWDPLGARLLESLGYPAVATASAAVAYSLGYDDGERMPFSMMLDGIRSIAAAVDVPVSADIERGYSDTVEDLAAHVRRLIAVGVVGINLEDSLWEGGSLRPIEDQCRRIEAVRDAAAGEGVPLFLNARIDVFLHENALPQGHRVHETIERGKAYIAAGADGLYPIGPGDAQTLAPIAAAVEAPVNVLASPAMAPLQDLAGLGIRRVSLGPGLLRIAVTAMRDAAVALQRHASYADLIAGALTSDEIRSILGVDEP